MGYTYSGSQISPGKKSGRTKIHILFFRKQVSQEISGVSRKNITSIDIGFDLPQRNEFENYQTLRRDVEVRRVENTELELN